MGLLRSASTAMSDGACYAHTLSLATNAPGTEGTREEEGPLTTWINLVFLVTCSLPQAKFPVSSRIALYLVFPPRVLTSWIRFDESSLVMAACRPSSNFLFLRLEVNPSACGVRTVRQGDGDVLVRSTSAGGRALVARVSCDTHSANRRRGSAMKSSYIGAGSAGGRLKGYALPKRNRSLALNNSNLYKRQRM